MIEIYLEQYKNKEISNRQLCYYANLYSDEVIERTSFLNIYENISINERLYYIINNLDNIVKCKFCNNKAVWSGRLNVGYKEICNHKECKSKLLSESHIGKNNISKNRDNEFIIKQSKITNIDDNTIRDLIKYDKYLDLIDNDIILNYLDNRYKDSDSRLESVQRIRFSVEEKPKCPTCRKPVQWIGKKTKLYTKFCSNSCSANNIEITNKKKQTSLKKWGNEICYNSEIYKQRLKEAIGVEYHTQRQDIIDKRKDTLINKFGTTKLYQVKEIKEKIIKTNIKKFGCDCLFKDSSVRDKAYKSLLSNGHGTSKAENKIYNYFLELGMNVERFKKTKEFPYNIDFYYEPYNLYIEYYGSHFHNGRSFIGSKEDFEEIKELEKKDFEHCKQSGKKKSRYRSIINTWSIYDVKKRQYAKDHNINYIEIYDCKSKEDLYNQLSIWFQLYNKQIIVNNLNEEYQYYLTLNVKDLTNASNKHNNIVKTFQFNTFFKKEIDLFVNDPIIRRKLIQNRCKYLNKRESELTINDIITGFKKSGIYYGYSHFNPCLTNWFVNKFNIKTIYDPCGGWGHHLLGMLKCDKIIYNDYSKSTVENIRKIKDYFNISNLDIHSENALNYIPEKVDAWFMCPPYYNIENYECDSFNDISEYKDFLNRIIQLWEESESEIFGIVIREDLANLIELKFIEEHDISLNNSHFGKKHYKEKFLIIKK